MEGSISLRQSIHQANVQMGSKFCTMRSTNRQSSFFSGSKMGVLAERGINSVQPCPCVRNISVLSESAQNRVANAALATSAGEEAISKSTRVITRTKRAPPAQRIFTSFEKVDRFGRLRTPRAARELSLHSLTRFPRSVLYAAFVSGVHPLKVFDDRMKQRTRAEGFDKSWLEGYEHSPDVGENLFVDDEATAVALEEAQDAEALLEAEVLAAPPPLVYNNFATRLARSLVKATAERWLQQEAILMEILPSKWKAAPKGALLQICILQLALAEIETTDTSPNVIVNEAVELAKRFCDLSSPRIINGCLGSYTRRRQIQKKPAVSRLPRKLEIEQLSEPLEPENLGWNDAYHD